jgi:23S rRNA maturation mini-RNase III
MQPFEREYQAEKLMLIARAKLENREQEVIRRGYKATITHPLEAKEPPYYDEG